MANNRIYIECIGCEEPDLMYLAKRMQDGYYGDPKELSDWFDKHKHCGGSHDHFRLVYQHPENYDLGGIVAILKEKLRAPNAA